MSITSLHVSSCTAQVLIYPNCANEDGDGRLFSSSTRLPHPSGPPHPRPRVQMGHPSVASLAVILRVCRPPRHLDNDEFATVDALAFF